MTKGPTLTRRRLVGTTAAAALGTLAMPAYLRAQGAPIKIGVLQPLTGALARMAQPGRLGAEPASRRSTTPAASSRSAAPSSRWLSATPARRRTAARARSSA